MAMYNDGCVLSIIYIISFNVATSVTIDPYPQLSAGITNTPNSQGELEAIHYIGAGYNIFKGSPDGGSWSHGGDDPGVHLTRKILRIDQGNSPSQIELARHGCQVFHDYNLIYSPKSYQDRLRLFVQGYASQQFPGGHYAFTLSSDYNTAYHQTQLLHYVFQEYSTMCNLGEASYDLYSTLDTDFLLSDNFASSICSLSEQFSQNSYIEFLEIWGTHVIVEVAFGKKATNRYRIRLNEYFNYLLEHVSDNISEGGPLLGFQTSLKVDMNSFQYRPEYKELTGVLHQQISSTGTHYYDNNKLKIIPLDTLISKINKDSWPAFENFAGCDNKTSSLIQLWSTNLRRAISEYPSYNSAVAPQDTDLEIPLTWPNGTYSLQSTTSGCPEESKWFKGTRYEEMEQTYHGSTWSAHVHFEGFEMEWPSGDYCVYKHGPCPSRFQSGMLHIDDEDTANKNSFTGVLPDGIYNTDTTFNYCCRSDGTYLRPIWLPNTKPFYMFKYKTECQKVQGMTELEEYLHWDSEASAALTQDSGSHPSMMDNHYGVTVYYCYYTPNIAIQSGTVIGK